MARVVTRPKDPAFPELDIQTHAGLSIREYFAAKSMAGLLACDGTVIGAEIDAAIAKHAAHIARQAVAQADALIEELNRTSKD